jgi:hypothetical protein
LANKINNGNNEIFLIFTLVKKDEDIGNTELIVLYAKDLFKKKDLTRIILVSDWSISKKSSPLKLPSQMNRNLVGSIYMYGRLCIKFPQSRMKGERPNVKVVDVLVESGCVIMPFHLYLSSSIQIM